MVMWNHTTIFSCHETTFVLALQGDPALFDVSLTTNSTSEVVVKYLIDPTTNSYRFAYPFSHHDYQLQFLFDSAVEVIEGYRLEGNNSRLVFDSNYESHKDLESSIDWCSPCDRYTQHSYKVLTVNKNYYFTKCMHNIISPEIEFQTNNIQYIDNSCHTQTHYPKLFSWNSASQLCKDSGHAKKLPEFFDRNEQEELIGILKNMPTIFPMESLFIGLKKADHLKVIIHVFWLAWLSKCELQDVYWFPFLCLT